MWPLDRAILESAGIAAVGAGIHPDIAAEILERGLAIDPTSPNLLYHYIIQNMLRGEWSLVRRDRALFERVGPADSRAEIDAIYFQLSPTAL